MRYETDIFPSIDRIDNLIATPSEVRRARGQVHEPSIFN